MKKLLFCTMMAALPLLAAAQGGVVSAPALEAIETANKATLLKQLAEAVKQSGTLYKTYEALQKSVELYYEVNQVLRNVGVVRTALNRQITLVNTASAAIRSIGATKGANAKAVRNVQAEIQTVMDSYKENMDMLTSLLQPDQFKMTDGERLNQLQEIKKETESSIAKVARLQSEFEFTNGIKTTVRNQ